MVVPASWLAITPRQLATPQVTFMPGLQPEEGVAHFVSIFWSQIVQYSQ